MSDREEPESYAWVDEANAEDAYLATLSNLLNPAVFDDERMQGSESDYSTSGDTEQAARREAVRHKNGLDLTFQSSSGPGS